MTFVLIANERFRTVTVEESKLVLSSRDGFCGVYPRRVNSKRVGVLIEPKPLPQAARGSCNMINGAIIRAARGLLGWSAKTLADRAEIGIATLQRIEHANYTDCGHIGTIRKIHETLMAEGIRFLEDMSGEVGVALTREKASEIRHRDVPRIATSES